MKKSRIYSIHPSKDQPNGDCAYYVVTVVYPKLSRVCGHSATSAGGAVVVVILEVSNSFITYAQV